jgi:hypothetical protein
MALQVLGTGYAFGVSGATAAGIAEVTNASASVEFQTKVVGKKSDGEIGAALYGKKIGTVEVSGYVNSASVPALGGTITAAGMTGRVFNSSIEASNEDFSKATLSGKAIIP